MTAQSAQFQLEDFSDEPSVLTIKTGHEIACQLGSGKILTRKDINAIFKELTGSSDAAEAWTVKMYGCALELAELFWLRAHNGIILNSDFSEADKHFDTLERSLPPQYNRHDDQIALQQFSTPARLAWIMAVAAGVSSQDSVLEPSAGTGVLALWPYLTGAKLILNEIDDLRKACLVALYPDALLTSHDGELIDELLAPRCNPNLVHMNPPFARSVERGSDGRTALRHLRSAWRRLAVGGRLVAVMPEGFSASKFAKDSDAPCTLRLNARISRSFSRRGTGVAVRMVVFDKRHAECEAVPIEAGNFETLYRACIALPSRGVANTSPPRCIAASKPLSMISCQRSRRPSPPIRSNLEKSEISEDLAFEVLETPAPTPEQKGIYLAYRSSRIAIDNAPVHPTPLVESVAMGSVAAPIPECQPVVPAGYPPRNRWQRRPQIGHLTRRA
ncbi:hypothetical protein [Parasphingorhabdus sp.]|uniref:hypothetical protein n=1 Tax=Parasphingorhabdus sp. TaxID=2709688 RepID=UPI002F9330EC